MKKSKIYIILVILLVLVSVFLIINKSSDTTMGEEVDFAINDTTNVTKIFLADKKNHTILLTKQEDGSWKLNDKYKASGYAIRTFLLTASDIEVKAPVAKEAHENIVKVLATTATKVEIYQRVYRIDLWGIKLFPHEKMTRCYYVGMATQDNTGTFMLKEGSDVPYIMHIPGFNGYLSTRYSPLEKDWRDHTVFASKYKDIKSVTLQFPETPQQSFRAEKTGDRSFMLLGTLGAADQLNAKISSFDTLKVMDLFSSFQDVRFEAIIDQIDPKERDSIINSKPFHILTLETIDGQKNSIRTFHMKGAPDDMDDTGKPVLWDRDRMYALINNGQDLAMIQFFVFDNLIRPVQYYLPQAAAPNPEKSK
jgi:hypothetical protein